MKPSNEPEAIISSDLSTLERELDLADPMCEGRFKVTIEEGPCEVPVFVAEEKPKKEADR